MKSWLLIVIVIRSCHSIRLHFGYSMSTTTPVRPCIHATTTLKTTRNVVYYCISDQINRCTAIMPSLDFWVLSLYLSVVCLIPSFGSFGHPIIRIHQRQRGRDNEGADPLLISVLNAETLSNKLLSKYLRTGRDYPCALCIPRWREKKTPTRIEI